MKRYLSAIGILKGLIPPNRPYGKRVLGGDYVAFLEKGKVMYQDENSPSTMIHGPCLVYVPATQWHCYDPVKEQKWSNYWITFNGSLVLDSFGEILPKSQGVFQLRDYGKVKELWQQLNDVFVFGQDNYLEYACCLFHSLLMEIFIQLNNFQFKRANSKIQEITQHLIDFVNKPEIDYHQLATSHGMSYDSFRFLFKKETGMSPKQYFLQLKVRTAQSLLKDPNYNVNEIASILGFYDQYYFSKVFKAREGVSPSQYRKRYFLTEK